MFFRFVYLEDCGHSIESKALEQWMNQNDEEITLKQCPMCKTPILKTQRFMNQVKFILEDISKVKEKLYGELNALILKRDKILQTLNMLNNKFYLKLIGNINELDYIKDLWDVFCQPLLVDYKTKKNKKHYKTNHLLPPKDIESLGFTIDLFESISKYKTRIIAIKDQQMNKTITNHFVWLLSVAFTYNSKLSNQQKCDINLEMIRGANILNLFEIMSDKNYKMVIGMRTTDAAEVENLVLNVEALLMSCKVFHTDRNDEVQQLFELVKEKVAGISIVTNEERRMIHIAMSKDFHQGSRAQGHWCKCPNGHIYCITECGGPMVKSSCPECKVEIGGSSHRHVEGTSVATEMDGAIHLAWSSGAQMGNYMF